MARRSDAAVASTSTASPGSPAAHRRRSHQSHTSFRSSAKKRRLTCDDLDITTYEEEEDESFYEAFLKKTWHTFRASPLYKFSYDSKELKRYSSLLSAFLEARMLKGEAATVITRGKVRARFSLLTGIPKAVDDEMGVQIKVESSFRNGWREVSCIYLCGVNCKQGTGWFNTRSQFVILPLLLASGKTVFRKGIIAFLRERFNCIISELIFPSTELSWMAGLWAVAKDDDPEIGLQLLYDLPDKELKNISYRIDQKSVKKIWRKIHRSSSDEMTHVEVEQFIDSLEKHFESLVNINLKNFSCTQISTPAARVDSRGRIKVFSRSAAARVLRHLTCLSQEGVLDEAED